MENVERLEQHEDEIRGDADELEQRADELEQRSDELGRQIGETREEFERRQQSAEVPGAQEHTELMPEIEDEPEDSGE